tara:strand:- start:643 stop:807 length:165 start_codon:yes stop_codon:yes gene_type:complete
VFGKSAKSFDLALGTKKIKNKMQKLWLRVRAETKRFPASPTCHSRSVVYNIGEL